MTDDRETRQAFSRELGLLAEVLRRDAISSAAIGAYFEDLSGFDLVDVVGAIRHWRRHGEHFPVIAELALAAAAERRRRADSARALPAAPPSPAEQAEVHGRIRTLIERLARGMRGDQLAG